MPLQDLTPQLRTRLSRVERLVGVFVTVATLLLVGGFAYYIYHTAARKGWFLTKIKYATSINNAAGLKVGAPVKLMGIDSGMITEIKPNDPNDYYGLTVYFEVMADKFGYIWTDSQVRVASGVLGDRALEVSKGQWHYVSGVAQPLPTVTGTNPATYRVLNQKKFDAEYKVLTNELFQAEASRNGAASLRNAAQALRIEATNRLHDLVKAQATNFYVRPKHAESFWLRPLESRPIGDRLEDIGDKIEAALPNFLALTNQINNILFNASRITDKLDTLLADARPAVTNLAAASAELPRLVANATLITQNLTNGQGSLGQWLLTSDITEQLDRTFDGVNQVMDTANTNLITLNETLESLSQITSNLSVQVRANTNMLSSITQLVIDSDTFVQGLKKHWLLRSAFKTKEPAKKK
jgi:ABC-type transporter Mla subunit MlaD